MRVRILIKARGGDGWQLIDPAEVQGPTFRDALAALAGKQVVTEVDVDGKKYYCCGTDPLRKMMAPRGQSVVNQDAGQLLDLVNPGIMDIPLRCDTAAAVFENSQLEEIAAELPDVVEQQTELF
ncbi:hypothetical protein [Geomonas subterranea]|uniref:hypothetical protein n=1 Tax=Geomonas subterranea TaxID=2847989 RepID=UPI001CD815F8|nr:hypothetical protein [Geomonas fuzhouensis]